MGKTKYIIIVLRENNVFDCVLTNTYNTIDEANKKVKECKKEDKIKNQKYDYKINFIEID